MKTILIDPGHGVDTPGKRSPDGVFREYLFNRQVSAYLFTALKQSGIPSEIIVKEDTDVPLAERAKRVNDWCKKVGKENVILVSIHANAAGDGTSWKDAKGWSCYTSHGKTESDRISEFLYDAFEIAFPLKKIRKDMTDGDRDWEANFYVLTKTQCPSVLLENFFYDNRGECAWLLTNDAQMRIADAIVDGLKKYLNK